MIFTHLCRAVAVLGTIYGLIMLWYAFILKADVPTQSDMDLRHGLAVLFGSIVLGTLAEISFSVRKAVALNPQGGRAIAEGKG